MCILKRAALPSSLPGLTLCLPSGSEADSGIVRIPGWNVSFRGKSRHFTFPRSSRISRPRLSPAVTSCSGPRTGRHLPCRSLSVRKVKQYWALESFPRLERASEAATQLGAKRYLSGWFSFSQDQWRAHYGEKWSALVDLKQKFDPKAILNPTLMNC